MSKPYSDAKKIEVVTSYIALGKAPMVEAVTGVPRDLIRQWKMQPWWKELELEIRSEETAELDTKLAKIVDRTLDCIIDRVDNGDFILDSRSGTIKRVPVKLKDVHRVSTDLIDKRILLKKQEYVAQDKTTIDDVIKKLATQFAEFALRKTKESRKEIIIEGEVIHEDQINAIHEKRETRLQEGSSLESTTGTNAETSGAEQSP